MSFRLRRSALYVPGSNQRALAKAAGLAADALILDLEDAVLPGAKPAARDQVLEALAAPPGRQERVVRVNGLDTAWGADDLRALARSGADALLLPKIDDADMVEAAGSLLEASGAPDDLALWVMAETPGGVLDIRQIAAASRRLAVIVMGTNDLARALRMPAAATLDGLETARSLCVLAARAEGLDILDGVFGDLEDAAGLRASCQQGRRLGFDGKTLIHPSQIPVANEMFGVSAEEAALATEIIAAWEAAAREGSGVAVVRGRMVEQLHADEARRLLALHQATTEEK
ncbi:MAG: CoA ester lyase [Chromatiales bacterium]|nr:CoA ester lyase [Chromatiales bacterium]